MSMGDLSSGGISSVVDCALAAISVRKKREMILSNSFIISI
jgi:hypothetical protein